VASWSQHHGDQGLVVVNLGEGQPSAVRVDVALPTLASVEQLAQLLASVLGERGPVVVLQVAQCVTCAIGSQDSPTDLIAGNVREPSLGRRAGVSFGDPVRLRAALRRRRLDRFIRR
jgi:hypothetical protein